MDGEENIVDGDKLTREPRMGDDLGPVSARTRVDFSRAEQEVEAVERKSSAVHQLATTQRSGRVLQPDRQVHEFFQDDRH